MRSRFLNALSPSVGANVLKVHDAFLASFYHWRRANLVRRPGQMVVGDSGGFSVATKGAVLDPEEVMGWQIANTDLGYILDMPPYREASAVARVRPAAHWDLSLRYTLLNVERALPHYDQSGRFRWWGIVQGQTRAQQEEWYGAVASVYPFDRPGEGWAMRRYPHNKLGAIARCVRFAADHGINNLHMLQTTGPAAVAVLLGLARIAGLQFVTYDSATTGIRAIYRWCTVRPESFPAFSRGEPHRAVTGSGDTSVQRYMRSGACSCSGCADFPEVGSPPPTEYAHRLLIHEYCWLRDNFDAIAAEAEKDPEQLIRTACTAHGISADAVFRAFERARSAN